MQLSTFLWFHLRYSVLLSLCEYEPHIPKGTHALRTTDQSTQYCNMILSCSQRLTDTQRTLNHRPKRYHFLFENEENSFSSKGGLAPSQVRIWDDFEMPKTAYTKISWTFKKYKRDHKLKTDHLYHNYGYLTHKSSLPLKLLAQKR